MKNFLCSERLRASRTDGERTRKGSSDKRTNICSDFGRVVFSSACRRMHDKTQVFPLTKDDNIHSRLTHSLEVMTLGRSFAVDLMVKPKFRKLFKPEGMDNRTFYIELDSLLSTICLSHDIGNPPFGHFGETTIQKYFTKMFDDLRIDINIGNYQSPILYGLLHTIDNDKKLDEKKKEERKQKCLDNLKDFLNPDNSELLDFTSFDGNAQGFRVLTKTQFLNDLYGLNLTYASLASFLKYPNFGKPCKEEGIALHKHGVFITEREFVKKVMDGCNISKLDHKPSYSRHPFSFIMEACDTICYLVMDIEDAYNKGWISFEMIEHLKNSKLKKVLRTSKTHYDKDNPERKKIVQLRVDLINYFVSYAMRRFMKNLQNIIDGSFNEELLFDKKDKNCLASFLSDFSVKNIYSQREIQSLELTGDAVLTGIMDHYVKFLFSEDESYRMKGKKLISHASFYTTLQEHLNMEANNDSKKAKKAWLEYTNFDPKDLTFGERIRIIRDFVSGMTDRFALLHYQKLNGQKI